jgi:hypothetical protein
LYFKVLYLNINTRTLKKTNLILVATLLCILATKHPYLLYYWSVMTISILFLNSRMRYQQLATHSIYNAIFCGYLVFIVLNRIRSYLKYKFSPFPEEVINIAEHGFFAGVICLKILVYLGLFTNWNFQKKCLASVFALNFIGIFNEFFQSWLQNRNIFHFTTDSQKDLLINFLGSIVFYLLCFFRK